MKRPPARATRSLRLKPADPFELIRWLARSQSDPRKAVAELVQNSIDAGATRVDVQRLRVRGEVALVLRDDGAGVLPELEREEALTYIATHVGRSRKLGIDPAERAKRVIAGQYGVGLLGFWAIRSRHDPDREDDEVDDLAEGKVLGIPEPVLVSDADSLWRSRMQGDRWEVNDTHEDYRSLRDDPRARVRYLLALLAKELVLRSAGRPDLGGPLESLVEILAHAERNLRGA